MSCDNKHPAQPPAAISEVELQFQELLNSHKGKTIYLDFWASWCRPCRKSFPWLNSLNDKFDSNNFIIISINLDMDKRYADKFLAEVPAQFEVFFDPDSSVAKQYSVQGMPTSILISPAGNIVDRHRGFSIKNTERYEDKIMEILSE